MPDQNQHLNNLQTSESKEAFEAFFKAYYHDLYLWSSSIVKDSEAAEDIVQEFFLNFWEKKRYRSIKKNLQSYIFRSVRNASLNYLERVKRVDLEIDHLEEQKLAPQVDLEVIERNQQIYSAINELPDKCKEVFTLCCINGYTYKEAAEDLDVTINTVRTHMVRAFKFLREKLQSPHLFYSLFLFSKKRNKIV